MGMRSHPRNGLAGIWNKFLSNLFGDRLQGGCSSISSAGRLIMTSEKNIKLPSALCVSSATAAIVPVSNQLKLQSGNDPSVQLWRHDCLEKKALQSI